MVDSVAIYVNGSTNGVSYTAGQTSWSYNGTLQTGQNPFTIIAKDAAGNASDADSITVPYTATSGIPVGGYINENAAEVGGGCFIATAGFGSEVERGVHSSPGTAAGYCLTPVTSLLCMLLHIHPMALLSGLILLLPPLAYVARRLLRSNRNFAQ